MNSKKNSIRAALKHTLDVSTIHSVPNIIKNKFVSIKVMWIICLMLALGCCIYFIFVQIADYLSFGVVLTIKQIYKSPISFPIITICNVNFFAANLSFGNDELNEIFNDAHQTYLKSNISEKMKFFYSQSAAIAKSNYITEELKGQLGYSFDQTIISCIFKNNDCSLEQDFTQYFDPLYGKCFQFNSDKSKTILLSGSLNGLKLELFLQSANANINKYALYNGFYIYIGNEKTFNSYNIDGISVAAGLETNIALTKQSFHKQPKPYSNCVANLVTVDSYPSEVYKMTFMLHNQSYTRDFCSNVCFQLSCGKTCGCYDVTSGPFPSNLRPCLNETDLTCENSLWNKFLNQHSFSNCDCPYECDEISYPYSTSLSEYPTKTYANYLLKNPVVQQRYEYKTDVSYEQIKNSVVSVNIFYNELIETEYSEEVKITIIDLISNIGGILGLFTGAGFLSFIEFVEIFMQTFYIIIEKKNQIQMN